MGYDPHPMANDRARILVDYIRGRLLAGRSHAVDVDVDTPRVGGELATIGSILRLLDRRG